MDKRLLYIIIGIIFLVAGFLVGWTINNTFTKDDNTALSDLIPVSNEPLSDSTGGTTQTTSNTEDYYKSFTIRGRIASINDSEIQLGISNIDVPEATNLGPNDSGKRKILITDQTEIAAQPENTMGNPVPVGGTNSAPSDTDKKDFKIIAIKDLAKDDIVFVMTLEDVRKSNDLTALKIIKERRNLMIPAPITP